MFSEHSQLNILSPKKGIMQTFDYLCHDNKPRAVNDFNFPQETKVNLNVFQSVLKFHISGEVPNLISLFSFTATFLWEVISTILQ